MSSLIEKTPSLFNPALRFAFTNITTEDLVSAWNGSPIIVKAGQTVELPHHLANKLTDELVDKIMLGKAKLDEITYYKNNPNTAPNHYRANSQLGVPAARKVWEDQIVRELKVDEESPEIQILRSQIKEELQRDMAQETSSDPVHVPSSLGEFSELGKAEEKAPKKPLKLREVK